MSIDNTHKYVLNTNGQMVLITDYIDDLQERLVAYTETIERQQKVISKMDDCLIKCGVNFDFDKLEGDQNKELLIENLKLAYENSRLKELEKQWKDLQFEDWALMRQTLLNTIEDLRDHNASLTTQCTNLDSDKSNLQEQLEEFQGLYEETKRFRKDYLTSRYMLDKARNYIIEAKQKWAPNTTNSDVDQWLKDYDLIFLKMTHE